MSWTADLPKLLKVSETLIGPYEGPHGWHQTRRARAKDATLPEIRSAIEVCRSHKWVGYIEWRSFLGVELDSCQFLRRIDGLG